MLGACSVNADRPVLRIASDATFAPFHFTDDQGRPGGFDIELARAVAERAGFTPEVLVLAYDDLFSGLKAGSHQMVAATTGITLDRQQLYLFSEPYFTTCQVAVVRTGPMEPAMLADLRGARIGAGAAGTSTKAMQTIDGEQVHLGDGEGLAALAAGRIDAFIVDEFDGVAAARDSQGRFRVLSEAVLPERYAFVLAAGRADLKERIDQALAELEGEGEIARLRVLFGVERGPDWPVAWQGAVRIDSGGASQYD